MKKYIIILLASALTGCNNFIDVKPTSVSTSSTFYDSEEGIAQGINGAYNELQTLYGTGSDFWAMSEERSDNTTFQYNNSDRGALQREEIDYFLITPDNNYVEGVWSTLYRGITQCNAVLDHVDKLQISDSLKSLYKGQANFIRALEYFNLVRLFGGVPLLIHQVNAPEEAFSKNGKATSDEVYEQIIQDVQDAIKELPVSWPSAEAGRATKGAAYTLLGEVYMTQKKFDKAISAFKNVTGYSLLPHYSDLFNPKNKNSVESIFEIQFTSSIEGEASSFIYTFAPLFSGAKTIASFSPNSGGGRNIPTRDIVNAYENGDLRKKASIAWYVDPDNRQYYESQGDSLPYIKKIAFPPSIPNEQDVDFYVYRYAQVMLWMAEALNEIGQTSQAYPLINEVRDRAGLKPLQSGLDQSEFREAIYHEERVESAFEDHRWFQLLRTGRAIQVMSANGIGQKGYQKFLPSAAYDVQKYKLLFPIPKREVDLNHLKQNPGWPQ